MILMEIGMGFRRDWSVDNKRPKKHDQEARRFKVRRRSLQERSLCEIFNGCLTLYALVKVRYSISPSTKRSATADINCGWILHVQSVLMSPHHPTSFCPTYTIAKIFILRPHAKMRNNIRKYVDSYGLSQPSSSNGQSGTNWNIASSEGGRISRVLLRSLQGDTALLGFLL